jgi:glutamate--cysteine ligase
MQLTKTDFISYIISGIKTEEQSKVGLEIEGFLYNKIDFKPLPYLKISDILKNLKQVANNQNINISNVIENNNLLGLSDNSSNFGNISLEPGAQFEFSSLPYNNINTLKNSLDKFFEILLPILEQKNIGLFYMGHHPNLDIKNHLIIPKERYSIMQNYMPKVGSLGLNMMKATGTLQANLDFTSEEDLKKKMQVSMALGNIISILFMSSPIINAKESGFLSFRNNVWLDTDNARSGILNFALNGNFSIEQYIDYALNTPMYLIYRNNKYIDATGIIFKDFISGKSKIENIEPTFDDFELHLTTLFPNVRLKKYLEIRTMDAPSTKDFMLALPALYTGLFYNSDVLDEIYNLTKSWNYNELIELQNILPKVGFNAKFKNQSIAEILHYIVLLSYKGLVVRNLGEEIYLTPLLKLIEQKETIAEQHLKQFKALNGDINQFIKKISIN